MKQSLEEYLKTHENMETVTRVFTGKAPGKETEYSLVTLDIHNAKVGEIAQLIVVGNSVLPVIRSDNDSMIYATVSFAVALENLKAGATAYRHSDPEFVFELFPADPEAPETSPTHKPHFVRYMRGRRDQTKAIVGGWSIDTMLSEDWYVARRDEFVNFTHTTLQTTNQLEAR